MAAPLPLYQLLINEDEQSDLEVTFVSLVDKPAIEKNFIAFKQQKGFAFADQSKQILLGPAMIPNMPIYRQDAELGEYNVVFTKETIQQIAEKFFAKGFQNNVNIGHDVKMEGVTFYTSFIQDSAMGVQGFGEGYPDGTWFLGAKVNNPEVWSLVQSGQVKGFSVEGLFKYKKAAMSKEDELIEKIKEILHS
jgi:hypothetical protein